METCFVRESITGSDLNSDTTVHKSHSGEAKAGAHPNKMSHM